MTTSKKASPLAAARADRADAMTINKAAADKVARDKAAEKAAKKAAKKAKKAAKADKPDAREEAAEAVNGVSLAALRLKAANAAVTGGKCVAEYAKGLADKYGKECAAAARSFKENPTSNLGKIMDAERTLFIDQCTNNGASRGNARVYWSRVLNAVDNGRGTGVKKALNEALLETAIVGAKKALHWERDHADKKLNTKDGKALGHYLAIMTVYGQDLEAFRVQCAKAPTVGVAKKK